MSKILTKTLTIAERPSSAPRLSVALTSKPSTRPAKRAMLPATRTRPDTGSTENRPPSELMSW